MSKPEATVSKEDHKKSMANLIVFWICTSRAELRKDFLNREPFKEWSKLETFPILKPYLEQDDLAEEVENRQEEMAVVGEAISQFWVFIGPCPENELIDEIVNSTFARIDQGLSAAA